MELPEFSLRQRSAWLKNLDTQMYDLAIIGGGITGAGIALDASSRGLKVVLIEKEDFASGTSSRSTKLIHGGLRYLKQFDFKLVHEVGTERAVVHHLAPHLVIPEKMLLPITENGSYGKWLTSIGLYIYDYLASVEGDDQRKMLSATQAREKEPLLPEKGLLGAGYYAEYRTDDARLTLEIIKTGLNYGLTALNYTRVDAFNYREGKLNGLVVTDTKNEMQYQVSARCVVNAAGPWVDLLRSMNMDDGKTKVFLSKGVHLVFDHRDFPVKQSLYFDAGDGRMIFAIPRNTVTYVGTTETAFKGDPNEVYPDAEDVFYLLKAVNAMFPELKLTPAHIRSSWAGLRPLIREDGKKPSEMSRKDEILISDTGLISIAGGKLTGYRKMAQRVTNEVCNSLGKHAACLTQQIPLQGGRFADHQEVLEYMEEQMGRTRWIPLSKEEINYLVHTYGRQTDVIREMMLQYNSEAPALSLIHAEIDFGLRHECVTCPADYLLQRSGRLYFDIHTVRRYLPEILGHFSSKLEYNAEELDIEESRINSILKRISHPS